MACTASFGASNYARPCASERRGSEGHQHAFSQSPNFRTLHYTRVPPKRRPNVKIRQHHRKDRPILPPWVTRQVSGGHISAISMGVDQSSSAMSDGCSREYCIKEGVHVRRQINQQDHTLISGLSLLYRPVYTLPPKTDHTIEKTDKTTDRPTTQPTYGHLHFQ